ncbi:TetR/AcrR family transcriptional regulator [Branchiibius sp. NY16-3462-2]|uniref:TetR/AcrR family transcriptional regulator n=1 Tax=Branchiibius sp. NY16-3462-2 TaxID=1807500 RepID=UPI0025BF48D3|nr:TetR/AcrR family transcriptional regulator [Branchiibius sp. NY16-3462-2]
MTATNAGRPPDEELTARILRTTVDIVFEVGYDQLRIEHVAKRVGCGKTAIYRRFPDKGELVVAAAMSIMHLGDIPDTGDVVEDLLQHTRINVENQNLTRLRDGSTNAIAAALDPAVFPVLWDRFFRLRRENGFRVIERAVERGQIAPDTDPDLLLDTLASITFYRSTVRGIGVKTEQYRWLVQTLVANPPRVSPGS